MFADSLVLVRGGAGVYAFTDALKLREVPGPLVQSGSGRRWKSLGFHVWNVRKRLGAEPLAAQAANLCQLTEATGADGF